MTEKNIKKESWHSTGSEFGVSKERQIEIFEDVKEKLDKTGTIDDVEKYIAKTYHIPGETFVAGFGFCFVLVVRRMQDESMVRECFWDFLLGIKKGVINPFAQSFPVELIEAIALGRDVTKGVRISFEEYKKFKEKREQKPEVA